MNKSEIGAALDMLENPARIRVQLEQDLNSNVVFTNNEQPDDSELKALSDELMLGIAEALDEVRPEYALIRKRLVEQQEVTKRNFGDFLDIGIQTYEFIKNHWGEIAFILILLDNYGYLNKIKKNEKIKKLLETLLGKK